MPIPLLIDTAVTVPVNFYPLVDDVDFKSREVAVAIAMTLAFGAQEMTSISNPIGQKIWEGIYHGITGNHFSS